MNASFESLVTPFRLMWEGMSLVSTWPGRFAVASHADETSWNYLLLLPTSVCKQCRRLYARYNGFVMGLGIPV